MHGDDTADNRKLRYLGSIGGDFRSTPIYFSNVEKEMSRNTTVMDYESCAAEGFPRVRDRGYPPIDKTIAEVLRVVAQNLYITESSLMWAWYDAVALGKSDSFKAIRDRLMSKPVTLTRA